MLLLTTLIYPALFKSVNSKCTQELTVKDTRPRLLFTTTIHLVLSKVSSSKRTRDLSSECIPVLNMKSSTIRTAKCQGPA